MEMTTKTPAPRSAGNRSLVEIQHGRRGVARMLRRGLHGAKNWVLEPGEDGAPRSAWAKSFRTAVVLMPFWIALSAMTGGPERGGQPVSVPKALLTAMIVTVIGLACLSARERRLGREEPWADLPSLDTESSTPEGKTLVDGSSETPTVVAQSAQVSEAPLGSQAHSGGGNPEDTSQMTQSGHGPFRKPSGSPLRQAIPEGASPLTTQGLRPVETTPGESVPQAIPEGATVGHLGDPTNGWPGLVVPDPPGPSVISFHKATREDQYSQVEAGPEHVSPSLRQATGDYSIPPEAGVTASEQDGAPGAPSHTEFRGAFRQDALPQLSPTETPTGDPFRTEFRQGFAEPGPYEATEGPICEDWWLTSPDAPECVPPEEPLTPSAEAQTVTVESATAETPEEAPGQPYPPIVMRYFMTRVSEVSSDAEKDEARNGVMEWVRQEIASQRRSQADMARILGVGKATISRWVNDDPWADDPD